jgi:hypothetical protein
MLRTVVALVFAGAGVLFVPAARADEKTQPSPEFKLGQKFEGEIKVGDRLEAGNFSGYYRVSVPIDLKAGKNLVIRVTVLGQGRTVRAHLVDPGAQIIARSPDEGKEFLIRETKVNVGEVGANGKHTLDIYSDRVGVFMVLAAESNDELDAMMLQEKITQLEKELTELREKLKAKQNPKP